MQNNHQTLRKEDMESINRLPCLSCKEFTTVLGSGAYWGVDGELTWLVQSKGHGVVNA
ncbi:MAG: hypothetical protein IIB45_07180 [Candidatus Marinimicrobia bacterium]|nr:hypothetical protein [Candidatus Neomarinimicrobiota bacterium]